jgi:hypothetical protein
MQASKLIILTTGQFGTNYIIFRNVKIFHIKRIITEILPQKNNLKENKESDEMFENISFVEIESSVLINYSTNMCRSDQGATILERRRPILTSL